MVKGAILSECTKYRYKLWRIWDDDKPKVLFIMLNPSTADANIDDPTIRRCINYAKDWGYGGLYVGNLYAYRATDPEVLMQVDNPEGPENGKHLKEMEAHCDKVVCAWGNSEGRPDRIFSEFAILHYLKVNKDGTPAHPLYLRKNLKPELF